MASTQCWGHHTCGRVGSIQNGTVCGCISDGIFSPYKYFQGLFIALEFVSSQFGSEPERLRMSICVCF
jgi:hypothetical protein